MTRSITIQTGYNTSIVDKTMTNKAPKGIKFDKCVQFFIILLINRMMQNQPAVDAATLPRGKI